MKGKRQLSGLEYKKDPSRPGGGVFIAHGEAREGNYEGIPQGQVITSSDEEFDRKRVAFCLAAAASPTRLMT